MDKFWMAALKATGSVAVVGFLFWFAIQQFFQAEIINLFDSEQRFIIVLCIVCFLFICLVTAIVLHKNKKSQENSKSVIDKSKNTIVSRATIHGDFIVGDKNENGS